MLEWNTFITDGLHIIPLALMAGFLAGSFSYGAITATASATPDQSIQDIKPTPKFPVNKNGVLLKTYYAKTNPFSALQVIDNYGLLMFYCDSLLRDCIYYTPQYDAVVIAKQQGDVVYCFDVFGNDDGQNLKDIISSVAAVGTNTAVLGFTPKDSLNYRVQPVAEANDTLFVLNSKENIFANRQLMFPEISHT